MFFTVDYNLNILDILAAAVVGLTFGVYRF